ncbi:MAG: succinate-semialdehyde dehydrogenase/glutarate-semialdehyde dehydrogenase, partial [Moritella dasanensis]
MTQMPTLTSYEPISRAAIGTVNITTAEQLPTLVNAAQQAQRDWAKLSLGMRQQQLNHAFQQLTPVQDQLAKLIGQEMGKDYRRATYEAGGTVQSASYFTDEIAQALAPERLDRNTELQYRPLGIVAVIAPWNYPLAMANNLLMPALMAGNAVILKPSEETPLVAELFVNTLNKVLPKGLLQLAQGDGETGKALVASAIHMVAFTGSMATGKHIMASAAPALKRLVMELGGNDPMIVMASA